MDLSSHIQKILRGLVQSVYSGTKCYLKFVNKSNRRVGLVWLNYEGRMVPYKVFDSGAFVNIDTYMTHPWIFVDCSSGALLQVASKYVFECEEYLKKYPQKTVNSKDNRLVIDIKLPVWTLKQISLNVVSKNLKTVVFVSEFGLPDTLQRELIRTFLEQMKVLVELRSSYPM